MATRAPRRERSSMSPTWIFWQVISRSRRRTSSLKAPIRKGRATSRGAASSIRRWCSRTTRTPSSRSRPTRRTATRRTAPIAVSSSCSFAPALRSSHRSGPAHGRARVLARARNDFGRMVRRAGIRRRAAANLRRPKTRSPAASITAWSWPHPARVSDRSRRRLCSSSSPPSTITSRPNRKPARLSTRSSASPRSR